jgi:hypothetical protein
MSESLELAVKRPFKLKLFLILWATCVLGVVAVLPYTLTLQSAVLE